MVKKSKKKQGNKEGCESGIPPWLKRVGSGGGGGGGGQAMC